MYIEDQYIQQQFKTNFLERTSYNIVIYGVGVHTERLLENIVTDRIVGLMDAKQTGEVLFGKKVLSYEEVSELHNVIIVVIARNAVINVIYRRIEEFVKENGIKVYDVNGNVLTNQVPELKEHLAFMLNEEALMKKIDCAQVVSFDIFDTLVSRCVLRPRDIFFVIDNVLKDKSYVFSKERIKAERREMVGENPTIYMIYDKLQENLGLSDEEKEELFSLELETEKKFLKPRIYMCQLLEQLVSQGKKVYLISDMYFTKEILENILNSLGIKGYLDLFVSCEYGKSKEEGLFNSFLEKMSLSSANCLHIGDNYFADIVSAANVGMDTFQIYSPIEMLENSIYSSILDDCHTIEDNIVVGKFSVAAFNNPFGVYNKSGKLILNSDKEVVDLFVAPVMFKYSIWLVQQLVKNHNDYVLFPSRDGYVLQKLYEIIKHKYVGLNLPESKYFYTSRRAVLGAFPNTREDIIDILKINDTRSFSESIRYRFEVDVEDDIDLDNLSSEHVNKILDRVQVERKNYKKYINDVGVLKFNNIAFVDFVAMGTIQKYLQEIYNLKFDGYYFLKRNSDKGKTDKFKSYSLYDKVGDFQSEANIYKYYYFLESIITSYEGSFKYIDDNNKKFFYEDTRNLDTIKMLKTVHEDIFSYCQEMMSMLVDIDIFEGDICVYDKLLGFFSADYSDILDLTICHMANIDEFMGKIVTDINR